MKENLTWITILSNAMVGSEVNIVHLLDFYVARGATISLDRKHEYITASTFTSLAQPSVYMSPAGHATKSLNEVTLELRHEMMPFTIAQLTAWI